ncbi:hypothetical protein GMA3_42 [Gordonia phage GMA3]|uniref:Thymidylate synthase n=1 Tax=Gordonia phage GMA3 TaxID=1647284 RepID=A0A0K0NKV6_9CAUD|nr:thymidylate synthase [Gordonia phage GMA3]AKL88219.1 hypothetical protein GMA3_42 [Gordonia phage GMA3]
MKPVTPSVVTIGATRPRIGNIEMFMDSGSSGYPNPSPAIVAEFAGRACYQSFKKTNPKTAKTHDYIRNIISQKHYSVIEHVSITFYITGVSRNFTHELVRHRHLSYSELSGRYVDPFEAGLGYINPPAGGVDLEETFKQSKNRYKAALSFFSIDKVIKGKKAREAARAYLPGSLETRIVVSGNLRSWMEFVSKRHHPAADAEMYRAAEMIYSELMFEFPEVFAPAVREIWDDQFSQAAPKE